METIPEKGIRFCKMNDRESGGQMVEYRMGHSPIAALETVLCKKDKLTEKNRMKKIREVKLIMKRENIIPPGKLKLRIGLVAGALLLSMNGNMTIRGAASDTPVSELSSWDESIIYFMLTDRFYNGNPDNDGENCDVNDPGKYHGGDFAGVTQKLDYLKELGVNTIWITPIVKNISEGQLTGEADVPKMYGYHGYWAEDFTQLDPHLGTEEEFRTLVEEAHERGIKVMVDAVINHAGYGTEELFGDMIRGEADTEAGSDKKTSIYGLPDFRTEDEEVREQIIQWQTDWVKEFGIDCFRLDTVKHVEEDTWQELHAALLEINPEFKVIGEVYDAGYSYVTEYYSSGQMDALLDFDYNNAALKLASGGLQKVENYFEKRNAVLTEDMSMGGFLSSHDENGLMFELINRGYSEEQALGLMKAAVSMQLTAKGIPVIYYGEELGLTGKHDYPYQSNRYDMDWSLAQAENDMLQHYKTMLRIRNVYSEVWSKGTRSALLVDEEQGVLIFDRYYEGTHLMVALNCTEEEKTVTFALPEGVDSVTGNLYETYSQENVLDAASTGKSDDGCITITVPGTGSGGTYIMCSKP